MKQVSVRNQVTHSWRIVLNHLKRRTTKADDTPRGSATSRSATPSLAVVWILLGMSHGLLLQAAADHGPSNEPLDRLAYNRLWHVSQAGSDSRGDGSQDRPMRTIGQALARASGAAAKNRHAILVGCGIYSRQTLRMMPHVDLYGGFDPETWKRDIWTHATLLDGQGARRVLEGADHARLDGFTIQNGTVRGPGGGLRCDGVSPAISNNRFFGNKTLAPKPWKPRRWHETAHDGGAVYCVRGAKPTIQGNLFAGNETHIGRGGAIAMHGHCGGTIADNLFYRNMSGLDDPMRSSDGGGISVFDWSSPTIENNIILHNRALTKNDGGGIFVALWSSPVISRNLLLDNSSGDDGCALYVGGQEHRYDRPQDAMPGEEDYYVEITDNLLMGNYRSYAGKASAVRVTKQARGRFSNNLLVNNARLAIEKSAFSVVNNTILGNISFEEEAEGLRPVRISNNIMWGDVAGRTSVVMKHSVLREASPGHGNFSQRPLFLPDRLSMSADRTLFDSVRLVTKAVLAGNPLRNGELAGRVVRSAGRWGVVRQSGTGWLEIWGDLSGETSLDIMPTYRPAPGSPAIDRGASPGAPDKDRHGHSRPAGKGIDIGADEFLPALEPTPEKTHEKD